MATMKLYELVNFYHIDTDLTCSEAMFRACNEYYSLHLSEETRKMFSVMGIGMQTEVSCCGAFTVAVGIIGLIRNPPVCRAATPGNSRLQTPLPRHCGGAGQKAGRTASPKKRYTPIPPQTYVFLKGEH